MFFKSHREKNAKSVKCTISAVWQLIYFLVLKLGLWNSIPRFAGKFTGTMAETVWDNVLSSFWMKELKIYDGIKAPILSDILIYCVNNFSIFKLSNLTIKFSVIYSFRKITEKMKECTTGTVSSTQKVFVNGMVTSFIHWLQRRCFVKLFSRDFNGEKLITTNSLSKKCE